MTEPRLTALHTWTFGGVCLLHVGWGSDDVPPKQALRDSGGSWWGEAQELWGPAGWGPRSRVFPCLTVGLAGAAGESLWCGAWGNHAIFVLTDPQVRAAGRPHYPHTILLMVGWLVGQLVSCACSV